MCGRYTLEMDRGRIAGLFGLDELDLELLPRYNIAPSQTVAVVGLKPKSTRRGLAMLNWGLVPRWSQDPNDGPKPINARGETLLEKPTFRECFQQRRCLLPATGFYEWKKVGRKKEAYLFRSTSEYAFGGLWDVWRDGPRKLSTCCIITVAANDLVKPLHDRMPLMLSPADFEKWLNPDTPMDAVLNLLKPYPAELMTMTAVGPAVNSVVNESVECLAPPDAPATLC